jgi:multimeric flavodoxin WrbA
MMLACPLTLPCYGVNNLGGKKVAMAKLREVVTSLGHTDVTTYIQSGNVLFTPRLADSRTAGRAGTAALATELERAIADRLGVRACGVPARSGGIRPGSLLGRTVYCTPRTDTRPANCGGSSPGWADRPRSMWRERRATGRRSASWSSFACPDMQDPGAQGGLMVTLTSQQEELCEQSRWDFSDLRALFINCTLKRSPEQSHTAGLAEISMEIMRRQGVTVESLRAVDHQIATGVWPDMREHGWAADDWPEIFDMVMSAHILVLCTPIWLGEKSSVCTQIVERLYGNSHLLNDEGQYRYYGRVGGCLVTGNEDGVKHCAMNVLYSLQHLGYVIPPQADAGWIGAAGPGPSYLDPGSGGPDNDFTNRNTTFMTWNLMHIARMVTDAGGIPVHGNQRSAWDAGCRFDFVNPEYR